MKEGALLPLSFTYLHVFFDNPKRESLDRLRAEIQMLIIEPNQLVFHAVLPKNLPWVGQVATEEERCQDKD